MPVAYWSGGGWGSQQAAWSNVNLYFFLLVSYGFFPFIFHRFLCVICGLPELGVAIAIGLIWFCFLYGFLGFNGHEFMAGVFGVSRKQPFGYVLHDGGGSSGYRVVLDFGFLFLFGFWDILFYCVEILF